MEWISVFKFVILLECVDFRYFFFVVRKGCEGWVRLSYVIDEEGRVKDFVVEDFFGSFFFKCSVLLVVKKW